jgi:hypothetical protein
MTKAAKSSTPAHSTTTTSDASTPTTTAAVAPNLLTMVFSQAEQNIAEATAAVAQMQSFLPGLVTLPEAQRKLTGGRFRDGEAQALLSVIATCVARPELVASLADDDNGVDPDTFETTLLSSRIQLAAALAPLSATLTQLASNVDDTMLYLQELSKGPTLEAYAILKAVSKSDLSVKTAISPALDFYASFAKAAAATRKKNAAAKAAAASPSSPPPSPVVATSAAGK